MPFKTSVDTYSISLVQKLLEHSTHIFNNNFCTSKTEVCYG